jgi:hypothetical protein
MNHEVEKVKEGKEKRGFERKTSSPLRMPGTATWVSVFAALVYEHSYGSACFRSFQAELENSTDRRKFQA